MSDTEQKYKKLASAIYLITSFFGTEEPLKWRLRGLSADLVSDGVKDKLTAARDIVSLFGVAQAAGLVSQANYDILASELGKLSAAAGNVAPVLEAPLTTIAAPAPINHVSHIAPIAAEKPVEQPAPTPVAPQEVPEALSVTDMLPSIEQIKFKSFAERAPSLKEFGAVSVKKNSRQSPIIGLLKRKKEIMIKDVSPLISGCSEKTIQRELSEMVTAGILQKMGEKRWTRYTLAQAEAN